MKQKKYTVKYMRDTQFSNCFTCGKYFIPPQPSHATTCSQLCLQAYTKCYNCGKYFLPDLNTIKKREKATHYYCSKECSIVYKYKKQIIRKYTSRIYYF